METAEQLKAARGALDLTRKQLSEASKVSPETIKRFEGMTGRLAGNVSTIEALRTALEDKGAIFIPQNGGPPGVRFKIEEPVLADKEAV